MVVSGGDRGKRLDLVFITPCVGEDFFKPVRRGMEDAARMLSVDCRLIGTEDVDLEEQALLIRRAVQDGCDGIALSIPHPTALCDAVEQVLARGIPLVLFNVDATNRMGGRLTAVCQDCYQAGRTLGQRVIHALPEGSHVLMTVHSEGISALDDRVRGAQEILASRSVRWRMLTTGIDAESAAGRVGMALQADPTIAAVLCSGLADSEGAGLAVERHFPDRGLLLAAYDLSPTVLRFIAQGIIAFTIDQQPYMQGFYPVVQLALWCRYDLRPADIDAGATLITAASALRALDLSQAGYR